MKTSKRVFLVLVLLFFSIVVLITLFTTTSFRRENEQNELLSKIENISEIVRRKTENHEGQALLFNRCANDNNYRSIRGKAYSNSKFDNISSIEKRDNDKSTGKSSNVLSDIKRTVLSLNKSLQNIVFKDVSAGLKKNMFDMRSDIQHILHKIKTRDEKILTVMCSQGNGCNKQIKYRCFKVMIITAPLKFVFERFYLPRRVCFVVPVCL